MYFLSITKMSRILFQTLEGQEDIDDGKTRAASHNTTLQDFTVKVEFHASPVYYVVIEDLRYTCSNVVTALDLLMKLHLVFNIKYSFETKSLLHFFPKRCFQNRHM